MYLDSAYIAKFYLNESDSDAVRRAILQADVLSSSEWSLVEVGCAFHRHAREGRLTTRQSHELMDAFQEHVEAGFWTLIPVSGRLLRGAITALRAAPRDLFLRSGDAIQLASARDAGEPEIWTNDRHMLAAASYFGLTGRTAT